MKKSKYTKIVHFILFFFSFCLVNSLIGKEFVTVNAAASSKQYTTDIDSYYDSIDKNKVTGTALLGALHDLSINNHNTYTTYEDIGVNEIQKYIDADPDRESEGYIIDFYSQVSWPGNWTPTAGNTSGGYNREHVWCQSHSSGLWGEKYGGADMQHVRPLEYRANSSRNNSKYNVVTNYSNPVYSILGEKDNPKIKALAGYLNNDNFEPIDASKGDVARILMYVFMHYSESSSIGGSVSDPTGTTGNLNILDIVGVTSTDEAWNLLLDWSQLDAVSLYEINRNNRASEYQGNRNPFIDYPDLAKCIWGGEVWDWSKREIDYSKSDFHFDKTTLSIREGFVGSLEATQNASWSVSNDNISLSTYNGKKVTVSALNPGTATIFATYEDKTISCEVTVLEKYSSTSVEERTLTLTPTSTYDPTFLTSSSTDLSLATYENIESNLKFASQGVYTTYQKYYMFNYKNKDTNPPMFYNKENLGTIVSLEVTFASDTSESGKVHLHLGSSELNVWNNNDGLLVSKGGSQKIENSTEGLGYFQIAVSGNSVRIISIVVKYKLYTAEIFAYNFLDEMNCDPLGQRAPSLSSWENTKNYFQQLNDVERNIIIYSLSEEDSFYPIKRCLHYYDYIIAKYNKTTIVYDNYLNRDISTFSNQTYIFHSEDNYIAPLIITISFLSVNVIVLIAYRKRKEI